MKKRNFIGLFAATVFAANVFIASPANAAGVKKTFSKIDFALELAGDLKIPVSAPKKSCFRDVTKKTSGGGALCALKKEGVFNAFNIKSTGNFRPKSKVTWRFAIQSLCAAYKWKQKNTFSSCLAYAKKNGLLTEPIPSAKQANKYPLSAQLTTLLERSNSKYLGSPSIAIRPSASDVKSSQEDISPVADAAPSRVLPASSFAPVTDRQTSTDFFSSARLASPLPSRFYLDEVYTVEGDLVNSAATQVFVFVCGDDDGAECERSKKFVEKTDNGHFSIPVYFNRPGNFQLGIVPGNSGDSKVAFISVLPENPPASEGQGSLSTHLATRYDKGKTLFEWDRASTGITELTIFQENKRKDYILRQPVVSFAPRSVDFADFKAETAYWMLSQYGNQSPAQQITLTTQEFRTIDNSEVTVENLTEKFSAPIAFTLHGKALNQLSKKAALTLPDGTVEDIIFAQDDVSAGSSFDIELSLMTEGTYIFEINTPQGAAALNVPIHVGNRIPLLPDYLTLNPGSLSTTPIASADLPTLRGKMLDLINADRAKQGLSPLTLWDELSGVAQNHSQNMVTRNFFAHNNPSGETPEDRRKEAGIPVSIKENLGKAPTLELVEAGLMRSPIHRSAIVDPKLTRVGLGIAKNAEGYFLVTQNFSTDPITSSDLSGLEDKLFNAVNDARSAEGASPMRHDSTLRSVASRWSGDMESEDFFSLTNPLSGETFVTRLRNGGITSSLHINILKSNSADDLPTELLGESGLHSGANTAIGIGAGVSRLGDIYVTVVYTP